MRKIIASICVIQLAKIKTMPPERIELPTPGLQDQCSTTELKRHVYNGGESYGTDISSAFMVKTNPRHQFPVRRSIRFVIGSKIIYSSNRVCTMYSRELYRRR